ncbi:regulatory LuxR family protein [Chitinophaga dinghuensis]|uniref:Regulatory LuxR family protein n=1 Tax=Chitinophaga dinghuensis TaxID=1539050 RepID=A0A327W4S3_9BACT|nr:helix-turn-helix transcriptional regulator [Chitinophaga dinghuensis]RAJ83165.1 regulatory LuxR family protein [Chitinophaga dinghuensis]
MTFDLSIYAEVFKTNTSYYDEIVDAHVKRLSEIDNILPPSSTFLMLTNTSTYSYEFISRNIQYATGLDKEELYAGGIKYFLSKVHQEDIQVWLIALADLMTFCMTQIRESERKKMSFQYNYRLQIRPDKVVNVVENQIPLVLDDSGKPIIGLGHFTVYEDGLFQPIKAYARILNDNEEYETIYYKNYGVQHLLGGLSNREQDILRLLALRKTSKEIGESLFISPHTVDTHRRKILHKLNLSSTSDIIVYCRQNMFI